MCQSSCRWAAETCNVQAAGPGLLYNAPVLRSYWKTIVAVLGGNFIYFALLYPYLPEQAQHRRNDLDLGLLIDFWICLALWGLLALWERRRR